MPTLHQITDTILSANPEADVYVLLENRDCGQYKVVPYWECELSGNELAMSAIKESVYFAEECGMGTVISHIIDMRELRKVNDALAA